MADHPIPDRKTLAATLERVVNATERARVAGLGTAARLAADIAEAEAASLARIRFSKGPEAADAARPQTEAAVEAYKVQAKALATAAKAGRGDLDQQVKAREKARAEAANSRPQDIEVTLKGAAAREGETVALLRDRHEIAVASPDAKGIARFRVEAAMLADGPGRGLSPAGFRVGEAVPDAPVATVELRSPDGVTVARAPVAPDRNAKRLPVLLVDPRCPAKGGKIG